MTKPPRASETRPERIWVTQTGHVATNWNQLSDIGLMSAREYIRADKYAELEKQLSAATAALKEARDLAQQEALQTLADAVMKFAPDLGNQLAESWKDADGSLERFLTFLRSRP